jgi:site-specific recombinase XerD
MNVIFNFGISNKPDAKKRNIHIRVFHNKFDFRGSTSLEIDKNHWDFKKNQVKDLTKGSRTFEENEYLQYLNKILNVIKDSFSGSFISLKVSQQIKVMDNTQWNHWCRNVLETALGITKLKDDKGEFLVDKFEEYLDFFRLDFSSNTIRSYKSIRNVLERFQNETNYKYRTVEIDLDFYKNLREWSNKKGYKDNYFGTIISKVLAVMNHYISTQSEFKYHQHINNRAFKAIKKEVDHQILTPGEMGLIYSYCGIKRLENVRDIAILLYHGCLRWNELSYQLIAKNLDITKASKGYVWNIKQSKVGEFKTIRAHRKVLDLFLNNKLPESLSQQKFNLYIKELMVNLNINKSEINSHTFRRSFCTNMFNDGKDIQSIMMYSSHKSEDMLRSYIQQKNVIRVNTIPVK